MCRIIVIFAIMAMATADDQDCLKSVQEKLIGYKTILKDSLKVNQAKLQAEQENNQAMESLINDRANPAWTDNLQSGIQLGNNLINQTNPLNIINSVTNNGGLQMAQETFNQWVNNSAAITQWVGQLEQSVVASSSTILGGGAGGGPSKPRSDSPSLKAMMTDISQTVYSLNGIIKVIDEIFNGK